MFGYECLVMMTDAAFVCLCLALNLAFAEMIVSPSHLLLL